MRRPCVPPQAAAWAMCRWTRWKPSPPYASGRTAIEHGLRACATELMTTRRTFIKTLAAAPALLSFRRGWAANSAADPSRLALIIGNSSYRDAPLVNPANDARAVGALFTQAGFTVDARLDTTRGDMMAAIERFGAAAKRAETKLVVFYYAGHGAQLDWRNYLLPVDAVVEKPEDMKQRCVDLGLLLGQLSAAKDKTFVIILDACRNNPFGSAYRPEQKGLSQFDAPVGSLLAYATAPGNVASDGEGQNGLYTENLVRELGKRNTRIEDALKRVRLNVRLASHGEQIPWETTSLEDDIFIFSEGQKKLSESELEKLVEADVSEWGRIKSSKKIDDWVSYLQTFPNGRFAEIAQMRLARLLAEDEKLAAEKRQREKQQRREQERIERERQRIAEAERRAAERRQQDEQRQTAEQKRIGHASAATPAATPASDPATVQSSRPGAVATSGTPMIDIRAGLAVPTLIALSANPYSAGRYPLGRIFTVGDEATIRQTDILTGVEEKTYRTRVTRVDYEQDRVEFNNGHTITDLMGNFIKNGPVEFDTPVQFIPAEFQIGKKWTAAFLRTKNDKTSNAYYDMQIVKRETINVPAGSFDTFLIEGKGWNMTTSSRLEARSWLVPGLNFSIRRELVVRNKRGKFVQTERYELVALRHPAIGTM
ncbi:MAG: caspase family protein [Betaproteobacteria bacterium]|nr:caspase family protein [Betaproteobacteria bacterium]